MYVQDYHHQDIRVLDDSGAHVRIIGGTGEGPGESLDIGSMSIAPDGSLWVIDVRTRRYSVFDRAGTLVATQPQLLERPLRSGGGGVLRSGAFVDWAFERHDPFPEPGDVPTLYFPIRVGLDGAPSDTAPPLRYVARSSRSGAQPIPFDRPIIKYQDRDGDIWFADLTDYRIYRRTLGGDTTLVISLDVGYVRRVRIGR